MSSSSFLSSFPREITYALFLPVLKGSPPIHQLKNFHCSHKTLTIATLKDLITLPLTDCSNSSILPLSTQTPPSSQQWLLKTSLSPNPMDTLILYFVGQFQSISHYWTFPTIQKIIFPHHSIFLVCFSNYYHHLPDISLLLRYWFGLGHFLFSHFILSVGNAYVLSWLFLFICQRLCEVFASISVLPHFSHSSFKSHILKIHIIFLIKLSSSLISSFFLVVHTRKFGNIIDFPFFFYD